MSLMNFKATLFGGYDKTSTLECVSKYRARIEELEGAKEQGGKVKAFSEPAAPEKTLFDGFNAQDVDAFLAELKEQVAALEKELKTV
ncbi:MAG: hypothetical protein LUI06_09620 [Ruminococcus sp.]|nr:hypothetical protein [Ruminococcus sp.]